MATFFTPGSQSMVLIQMRVCLPDGFLPHLSRIQTVAFQMEAADFEREFSQVQPGMPDTYYIFSELFRKERAREERT